MGNKRRAKSVHLFALQEIRRHDVERGDEGAVAVEVEHGRAVHGRHQQCVAERKALMFGQRHKVAPAVPLVKVDHVEAVLPWQQPEERLVRLGDER
jgi:hypothetical protein